jgi:putative ABC transport system permease protein
MKMLRHALRSLRHSPGYTAACVVILALGIGANTAIFSLIDTTLLKPLPYPDVDRLVYVWGKTSVLPEPINTHLPATRQLFNAWRNAASFDAMGAFREGNRMTERVGDRPRQWTVSFVSHDALSLLGARAVLGHVFNAQEDTKGADDVVLLSDAYFENRFHRDPATLGKNVTLDGHSYRVTGVLPRGFELAAAFEGHNRNHTDLFLPLSRLQVSKDSEYATELSVLARLKPGVSVERARGEADAIAKQLHKNDPERAFSEGANVFTLRSEDQIPGLDHTLYTLFGAVGFLLLIACANLASLTLARAKGRAREIAVRLALGATRTRIAGQLLLESLIVSLVGAAAGLFLAMWIVSGLIALEPDGLDRADLADFRWPVFAFTAVAGIVAAMLFGWVPAWAAARTSVNESLKGAGRSATERSQWLRQTLTGVEVGIALMLLVGAGLLVHSVWNLFQVGVGFEINHLIFTDIELPRTDYADTTKRVQFLDRLLEQTRTIPGVTYAGLTSALAMHRWEMGDFSIAGRPAPKDAQKPTSEFASVTPGFLETMGVPLKAGRQFTRADVARNAGKGDGVAIINQTFAEKYLHDENPLGQRVVRGDRPYQIVGVTTDFRAMGPESQANPQMFTAGGHEENVILAMRTAVPPESLAESIRKIIAGLDSQLPPPAMNRMDYYFLHMISDYGIQMLLLGAFAALGLLLAMIGVFSVLAHSVASRTREFGVRLALGASPAGIGRLVAMQSAWPLGLGVLAGLAGSFALSRFLESQLFNVNARDPLVFTLAIVTVLVAAPFAIWLPVRRATRVECTEALREE